MTDDDLRAAVLRDHGAGPDEGGELLAYGASAFTWPDPPPSLPLDDEPCVAAWDAYAAEAAAGPGAWEVLRTRLPQLRFPVAEGMSETSAYRSAIRGETVEGDGGPGLEMEAPERLRVFVHPTPAGRLPVLVAGSRADFVALVRALARRGEPAPVPDSMGALMVGGYVNRDRVAALRRAWEAANPAAGAEGWAAELRRIQPRRELYQDRFVLLSTGPYSGVPAGEMGMEAGEWERASLRIRLEHEAAHYFTRRVLGSMRNAALDELLADYAGVVAAAGRYRADWALRFLGVDEAGGFRPGGRLGNYRGDPPLSDAAFAVLCRLVRSAAAALERFDAARRASGGGMAEALAAVARTGVEGMASRDGVERLERASRDPWRAEQETVAGDQLRAFSACS